MSYRPQILQRLASLQGEMNALAALLGQEVPAVVEALQPPAAVEAVAEEATGKTRWSFQSGARYRITGKNPFRNGNNFNLFEHLRASFGGEAFSREQLGAAIASLKADGRIDSRASEHEYVVVFLRFAGNRDAMTMAGAPRVADAPARATAAPARPGRRAKATGRWRRVGSPSFHRGSINARLWQALGDAPFDRGSVTTLVSKLRRSGELESDRSDEAVARLFVGTVIDRGLADPV